MSSRSASRREAAAPRQSAAREQYELQLKWMVALPVGLLLMAAGFEPVFDQLLHVFSVQELLVSMFVIALPVQIWAGWQFYADHLEDSCATAAPT